MSDNDKTTHSKSTTCVPTDLDVVIVNRVVNVTLNPASKPAGLYSTRKQKTTHQAPCLSCGTVCRPKL